MKANDVFIIIAIILGFIGAWHIFGWLHEFVSGGESSAIANIFLVVVVWFGGLATWFVCGIVSYLIMGFGWAALLDGMNAIKKRLNKAKN